MRGFIKLFQVGTNSTDVVTAVSVDPEDLHSSYGVAIGGYTAGSLAAPGGERSDDDFGLFRAHAKLNEAQAKYV